MKKDITVKQTNRFTLESNVMHNGIATIDEYSDYQRIKFIDSENANIVFYCFESYMEIHRFGEAISELVLKPNEKTQNKIKSEYGMFEIEIYTLEYTYKDNYLKVIYDIENGTEDKDGFIIELEVTEVSNEYN